jgi:hypothetical protein
MAGVVRDGHAMSHVTRSGIPAERPAGTFRDAHISAGARHGKVPVKSAPERVSATGKTMYIPALQLSAATSASLETRHLSLLMLTVLITLAVGALRALLRRTHVIVVVGGASVMLTIIAVLAVAYLITLGTA